MSEENKNLLGQDPQDLKNWEMMNTYVKLHICTVQEAIKILLIKTAKNNKG